MLHGGVSIIIPCFNGARYLAGLATCLATVKLEAREIIFVDDGSTDSSGDLFVDLVPKARVVRQINCGVASARNAGAAAAQGEFLQFLDADDVILPGKLDAQASYASRCGMDVLYSGWQMVVVDGQRVNRELVCDQLMPCEPVAALLSGWWVPPHAYLIRRSAYVAVGGSDASLVNAQDYDLLVRMAIAGCTFGHMPGHYCDYYRYLEATSLARGPRRQYWSDYEKAVENAIALLERSDGFDDARRMAAAQKLHSIARSVYSIDRVWFDRVVQRIHEIAPGFVPVGTLSYKTAVRVLGMSNAERTAAIVRRCKALLSTRV